MLVLPACLSFPQGRRFEEVAEDLFQFPYKGGFESETRPELHRILARPGDRAAQTQTDFPSSRLPPHSAALRLAAAVESDVGGTIRLPCPEAKGKGGLLLPEDVSTEVLRGVLGAVPPPGKGEKHRVVVTIPARFGAGRSSAPPPPPPEALSSIRREKWSEIWDRRQPVQEEVNVRPSVSVSPSAGEEQRKATLRAAEGAGLEVLRVINEPTAAAVAYGYGQRTLADGEWENEDDDDDEEDEEDEDPEYVVVYDLGGGTLDVSMLDCSAEVFEARPGEGEKSCPDASCCHLLRLISPVTALHRARARVLESLYETALRSLLQVVLSTGNAWLGGDDFDNKIADWVIQKVWDDDTADGTALRMPAATDVLQMSWPVVIHRISRFRRVRRRASGRGRRGHPRWTQPTRS